MAALSSSVGKKSQGHSLAKEQQMFCASGGNQSFSNAAEETVPELKPSETVPVDSAVSYSYICSSWRIVS